MLRSNDLETGMTHYKAVGADSIGANYTNNFAKQLDNSRHGHRKKMIVLLVF